MNHMVLATFKGRNNFRTDAYLQFNNKMHNRYDITELISNNLPASYNWKDRVLSNQPLFKLDFFRQSRNDVGDFMKISWHYVKHAHEKFVRQTGNVLMGQAFRGVGVSNYFFTWILQWLFTFDFSFFFSNKITSPT